MYPGCDEIHVHFDMEWNRGATTTALVQLKVANEDPWLIDLYNAGVFGPGDVPSAMKQFLGNEKCILLGCNLSGDVNRLADLGIVKDRFIELRRLAALIDPTMKTGLADMSERFLGISIDKWGQSADWQESPQLSQDKLEYASIDVIIPELLYPAMMKILRDEGKVDSTDLVIAPNGLKAGLDVEYMQSGRIVALAKIEFVGGYGETRKWGKLTVGANKALIKLTEVRVQSARPPFSFDAPKNQNESAASSNNHQNESTVLLSASASPALPSWNKKDKTLANVLADFSEPIIAVNTASLRLPISDAGQSTIDEHYPLQVNKSATQNHSNPGSEEPADNSANSSADTSRPSDAPDNEPIQGNTEFQQHYICVYVLFIYDMFCSLLIRLSLSFFFL